MNTTKFFYLVGTACTIALSNVVANACSCAPPAAVEQSLKAADAVFVGQIQAVALVEQGLEARVLVGRSWKGVDTTEVTIRTSGATCGLQFTRGDWYLLYATKDQSGFLRVSLCSRHQRLAQGYSGTLSDTEEFRTLGEGRAWEYLGEHRGH